MKVKCGFVKDRLMDESLNTGLTTRSDSGPQYEISIKLEKIIQHKLIDYDD